MNKMASRITATAWFAIWAFSASAAVFFGAASKSGSLATVSTLVIPPSAAAVVGFAFGHTLLDPTCTRSILHALVKGVWLTCVSYLLFTFLLLMWYVATLPAPTPSVPALVATFAAAFVAGLLLVGPIILAAGAIGAIGLYAVGRFISHSDIATSR